VKVLILHQHFKSPRQGGALRSYYLAKALVDRGISTTVITAHNDPSTREELIDGIRVCYIPIPYDNRFGFYKRSRSFVLFAYQAIRVAGIIGPFDLCYAISAPLTTGFAAVALRRRYNLPYIFEVGDLWPDAPIQLGFIKGGFFKRMLYRLERVFYERAEFVMALSPAIEAAIEKKIPGKRTELIPNMADTDFFKPEEKNRDLEQTHRVKGKLVVSYIGALGFANGLDHLLECARAAQKAELPVHFFLCGDGAMKESLQKSLVRLKLHNIEILPFVNRDGVRELLNITDAVFICYKPVSILETGSPNKYFDGLAAGKLVIVNFGGWIREEIEREHCGIFVDPKNPSGFVSSILPFIKDAEMLKAYQRQARALAEREYSRQILGEKFFALINRWS
jgi:glycosyltransferase involved in cell wall biosynthesis